jgi:hypothetical protein
VRFSSTALSVPLVTKIIATMEILRDIAHDATLKATIFVNKKMPRLMLYLYQYELLAHKIYREITLEATSFSSSCMSQLLQLFNWRQGFSREMALKATAFADSCMSQLLLVLFPYESDLLLFGVLNCVLQPLHFPSTIRRRIPPVPERSRQLRGRTIPGDCSHRHVRRFRRHRLHCN